MSVKSFVVIGGGAAGLATAIQIAKSGREVSLLEKSGFAPPRMCGEFLSPECLPILSKWGIQPACNITHINIYSVSCNQMTFELPVVAGSMQRHILESKLVDAAKDAGVELQSNVNVNNITQQRSGYIQCDIEDADPIIAKRVIVSAGKYYQHKSNKPPSFAYHGYKAHFSGHNLPECLEMHLIPGAYFGVIPVGEKIINTAMLMKANQTLPETFKSHLANWEQVDEWLQGPVIGFGIKPQFTIPNVYIVGDAAAAIPPVTGDGVGMAITSGVMVAEAALHDQWPYYRKKWEQQFAPRIRWGKVLHHIALSPRLSSSLISIAKYLPILSNTVFSLTRGTC